MLGVTLTLAGLFSVVVAQVPGFEGCPDVETISTFDVENYMGKWYEQYRYFMIIEAGGKCATANYTLNNDGTIKMVNALVNSLLGFPSQIEGSARIVDPKDPGKLAVKFPISPFESSYWILDTDYDSYAAVWSCQSLLVANTQLAWIKTREQNPSQDVIDKAMDAFKRNGLNVDHLLKTDQINC